MRGPEITFILKPGRNQRRSCSLAVRVPVMAGSPPSPDCQQLLATIVHELQQKCLYEQNS